MHVIKRRVLERLPSFSDIQLMSLGWSFANAASLNPELWSALRSEARRRGALRDANLSNTTSSSSSHIPGVPIIRETASHLVINKPRGLVVSLHGDLTGPKQSPLSSRAGKSPELQNLVATHLDTDIARRPEFAHGILHRLDKDTTGALLVAKNYESFYDLRIQFACGYIKKEYLAIVRGTLEPFGEWRSIHSRIATEKTSEAKLNIDSKIDASGKPALTQVFPFAHLRATTGDDITLVRIRIHTGRSHQIRVHLSSIGYPLLGDTKYGEHDDRHISSTLKLHSHRLEYIEPTEGDRVTISAPTPESFMDILLPANVTAGSISI